MNDVKANSGKLKGYVLVRDLEGHPVFDDLNAPIPKPIMDLLTDEDLKYLEELRNDTRTL